MSRHRTRLLGQSMQVLCRQDDRVAEIGLLDELCMVGSGPARRFRTTSEPVPLIEFANGTYGYVALGQTSR